MNKSEAKMNSPDKGNVCNFELTYFIQSKFAHLLGVADKAAEIRMGK